MSETGEWFKDLKESSRLKKKYNIKKSTQLIIDEKFEFVSLRGGIHLVITTKDKGIIDFWPSTGRWIPRNGELNYNGRRRGVFGLISYIRGEGGFK